MHFTDPEFTHSNSRMWNKAYKYIKKYKNTKYAIQSVISILLTLFKCFVISKQNKGMCIFKYFLNADLN